MKHIKSTTQTLAGPSPFTSDPEELEIEKIGSKISDDTEPIYLLPSHATSKFLTGSFFSGVSLLLHSRDPSHLSNRI